MLLRFSRFAPCILTVLVLGSLLISGCFGFFEASVPKEVLTGGWEESGTDGGGSWLGEGVRWSQVSYEVEQQSSQGPFGAYLTVLSIDAVMQLDTEEVSTNLDEQIQKDAAAQNVEIDESSRRSGERRLESGVKTLWFTYRGEAEGGSNLFGAQNEVRIVGEVWPDERSRITVVTVGLAQTENVDLIRTHEDDTQWHKIIMDPDGNVESGARGEEGLIYNVRSHGS